MPTRFHLRKLGVSFYEITLPAETGYSLCTLAKEPVRERGRGVRDASRKTWPPESPDWCSPGPSDFKTRNMKASSNTSPAALKASWDQENNGNRIALLIAQVVAAIIGLVARRDRTQPAKT